jgi:aspartate/methionine/tyrosine aminotransferase
MKSQKEEFDLSFGNSVAVRQAFSETITANVAFTPDDMLKMNYPVHNGDPELVYLTKKIIWRQMGNTYKHVFITNGATGADVIALRAYRQKGIKCCRIRPAPYYTRFPGMIEAAGMFQWQEHFDEVNRGLKNVSVLLLDLPANPTGTWKSEINFHSGPIILDAVYSNNVYCGKGLRIDHPHDILTGSFSKLLGINGIRLGWIATNDDLMADRIAKLITAEYCGLSVPSMNLLKCYLKDFDWEKFEGLSNKYLDANRTEVSKLEKYFGNEPVPKVGMFYYAPTDKLCCKLLDRAGIIYTKGSLMGTSDDFGRLNIGQDITLTTNAVKAVLKIDKI